MKKLAATSAALVDRGRSAPTSPTQGEPLSPGASPLRAGSLEGAAEERGAAMAALAAHYGLELPEHGHSSDASSEDLDGGTEARRAAFAVVCTEEHLRLYTLGTLAEGRRGTARKAAFDCRAVAAGVVGNRGRPAIVVVHADATLTVHSLPGLTCLARRPLPPGCGPEPGPLGGAPGEGPAPPDTGAVPFALSRDGQAFFFSADAEVTRLGLFAWTRQPEPPVSLYDWDTAAATAAASTPTAVPAERASSTDSATSAAMLPLKLFEGVRDTATGFVEGAVKLPILKAGLVVAE